MLIIGLWQHVCDNNVSLSARELCCRAGLHSDSFAKAADNLYRLGQIKVSEDVLRKVAESEGQNIRTVLANGSYRLIIAFKCGRIKVYTLGYDSSWQGPV